METLIMNTEAARPKGKHIFTAYGYPGENAGDPAEFAAACRCGFSMVGLATMAEAEALETAHYAPGFERPFQSESLYTKRGEEVVTQRTDEDAHEILAAEATRRRESGRPNDFMESLIAGYEKYKRYTDGQRPWLHKLANEAATPKPERKLSDSAFPRLVEMMQEAATHLQRPKVTFNWEGRVIQLSIAGQTARIPGSLNVTDGGPYGESTWYGRILPSGDDRGKFDAGRSVEDWVLEGLQALNDDPVAAAREHGQRTGACCFCNRKIETNESLEVGYGPICADRYGLPWG